MAKLRILRNDIYLRYKLSNPFLNLKNYKRCYGFFTNNDIFCHKSKLLKRCLFTGKTRSVLYKFKLSRMVFKSLASISLIIGVSKGSW